MRLIDADALKELILKERDAIPKTVAERYSFGVGMPNSHGNSMRGGIRKALRCMEQTPTIDLESLRQKGRWRKYSHDEWICTNCGYDKYCDTLDGGVLPDFCEGCGADMREG